MLKTSKHRELFIYHLCLRTITKENELEKYIFIVSKLIISSNLYFSLAVLINYEKLQQSSKPVTTKSTAKVLSSNERQKQSIKSKNSNATTDKTTDKKSIVRKPDSNAGMGLSTKNVPSKTAIKQKGASSSVKLQDKQAINKKNVMNTIHNVTVSSPPTSAGKVRSTSLVNIRTVENNEENPSQKHVRTRTRTIAPEESILFQRKLIASQSTDEHVQKVEKKNPVAYEINFEGDKKSKKITKKSESINSQDFVETVQKAKIPSENEKSMVNEKPLSRQKSQIENKESVKEKQKDVEDDDDDDGNYESDFESYESDFEAESSEEPLEKSTNESDSDEMEITKFSTPEKLNPERVDSGSFDMSVKKSVTPTLNQYDSIEDTVNSHDSGISYDDMQALNKRLMNSKIKEFYRRGEELMKKITFDNMNFDIFEQKPIPYEAFMSVYGQRGMMQASTQCESFSSCEECQTDEIKKVSSWTQFPSKFTRFGLENVHSKLYNEEKLGVGEEPFEYIEKDHTENIENIDISIQAINNFSDEFSPFHTLQQTSGAVADVKTFIQNASRTVLNILEGNVSKRRELAATKIPVCTGYFEIKFLEFKELKETIITKIWSSLCLNNNLITIHKIKNNQQNLLCLWDILHATRPIKIFSSWCGVKCIEVHPEQRDFIIAGCNDGTICLWNMQENSSFDDIIQPCEIISLNQVQNDFTLDNVAALKYLSHRPVKNTILMFTQSHSSQFCSLHENGMLSIWTLMQIENSDIEMKKYEMKFTHILSNVKLVKSISIDMNKFLRNENNDNEQSKRKKSAFEKKRYYFENDLFSDKVLKELQEIDTERLQRSKNLLYRNDAFTAVSFDLNFNELFIASDANFIVAISRLCLDDKARKIIANESNFISPSTIKLHPIDSNILAVGLTNGTVKFIKTSDDFCENSSKRRKQFKRSNAAFSNDENVLAKSCAFQNIVEREKKLYEETQALNNLESDELKAFMSNNSMQLIDNKETYKNNLKIGFDKNVFNSFDVSMGAVKLIEFNKTGQFMLAVINKELKIFDCWKNLEISNFDSQAVLDVKSIACNDGNEYMIILTPKMELLVNKLKF